MEQEGIWAEETFENDQWPYSKGFNAFTSSFLSYFVGSSSKEHRTSEARCSSYFTFSLKDLMICWASYKKRNFIHWTHYTAKSFLQNCGDLSQSLC